MQILWCKSKQVKLIRQIRMVVEEKEIEVEPGVFMWAFNYNGSVPGPIIVAIGGHGEYWKVG